jgi:5-methylcytosine-specific restriction protein A
MLRNPTWQRDELILALDLYFRHSPTKISESHLEVQRLSEVLNSLPIHPDRPDPQRFRNPNGVYMNTSYAEAISDPKFVGLPI